MSDADAPDGPQDGEQARLIASGSIVQQMAQVSGLLAMFVVITVLARRLSLAELGVYGLLTSLAGYLLVIQNAAATAAVRGMAAAKGQEARDRTFSTAAAVFALAGIASGLLIALIGIVLSLAVGLSDDLERQAVQGSLLIGAITLLGWPLTIYRDALRAGQLFVRAAVMDILGMLTYAAVLLALIAADADLAILIGASGTIPLFAGLASMVAVRLRGMPFRLRPRAADREEARALLRMAGYISSTEAAGVVIYALDRAVLGLFQSAATVGLYEGPVRAHNLVRALNGAVGVTTLPSASKYLAENDSARVKELLLRGSRYTLALVVPLTVTGMVLAAPILEVWLGERYGEGGLAMAILLAYWLVTGSVGVAAAIAIAAGKARELAKLAWAVALANLALSLALTPWIGLEGVAIGTTLPYLVVFPFQLRLVLPVAAVSIRELVEQVWVPAYTLGLALAAALVAARLLLSPDTAMVVIAIAGAGVLAYWIAYYALWLRPHERKLIGDTARTLLSGGRR
jgi:O-antigen/teichoic acid export membrane protein